MFLSSQKSTIVKISISEISLDTFKANEHISHSQMLSSIEFKYSTTYLIEERWYYSKIKRRVNKIPCWTATRLKLESMIVLKTDSKRKKALPFTPNFSYWYFICQTNHFGFSTFHLYLTFKYYDTQFEVKVICKL